MRIFPVSQRLTEDSGFQDRPLRQFQAKLSYYWSETKTASPYSPQLGGSDGLPDPISDEIGTFITARVQRLNFEYTLAPTLLFHLGAGYLTNYFTMIR